MFGYIFNNFIKGIYFNGLKYQKPLTIVRRLCSELLGGAVDSFNVNSRALTCGSLLRNMLNKEVTLLGWVSDHKLTNSSLDLRDSYGVVRCVLPEEIIEKSINGQSLVEVLGVVALRPQSEVETFYANGDVDVHIHTLNILKSNVSIDLALKILKDNRFSLGNEISRSSKFSIRTHTCGDLRADHVGCTVTLCGWLKFWRSPHFLVLVDAYGSTQCILSAEGVEVDISAIPLESVLLVKGTVMKRPPEAANKKMPTGDIEVAIKHIEILNPASELAFHVRQYQKPTDRISLHHRYLSLRFPEMQFNLRTRSDMINSMRKFLIDLNGFVEVETPTLFCRTPGGAREFLVPTKYKGEFYCLVQSPQQFKQMLMAGGIDRYFQVARCYRDESTRQDRQPEFTQLDIELSFTNRDGILNLTEELLVFSYPTVNLTKPFLRIPYFEALNKYGSDKPDISFNLNLTNISDFIKIPKDEHIGGSCLVVRQSEGKLSNTFSKALKTNVSKQFPNVKLYHLRIPDVTNDLESKHINEFIPNEKLKFFISENQLHKNDTIFLAFGTYEDACLSLGVCRTKIAKEFASNGTLQIIKENINKPLWITDFPLFVKGENGNIESCHHPFTAPCEEDIPLLSEDPLKVRALSYDLVINGYEIGGGSVRAHSPEMQEKLLDMLNIQPEPLAHLLRALRCGCPPHAGIALGLDRLTMLACGANSIRDVIAFPKSNEGKDPLSGAPNTVPEEELKYYHINVLQDKND